MLKTSRSTTTAIETTGVIDQYGTVTLDESFVDIKPQKVRIIVLLGDAEEDDPDETPTDLVIEGIEQGLHETFAGHTIPLSKLWEGIDAE